MLTILLACAPSLHSATASEGSGATLRELNLEEGAAGHWTAEVDEPGPVIVACEASTGSVTYGPGEDIDLRWSPETGGYILSAPTFDFCHLWLIK